MKQLGKGGDHSFIRLPHYVLKSAQFGALSAWAVKLLLEAAKEYKGSNNGDISLAFSVLKERGWRSSATVAKAKRELLDHGWLLMTRDGGSHRCSLYAVTLWPIDYCDGKIIYTPEAVARNTWQKIDSSSRNVNRSVRGVNSKPRNGGA